VHFTIDQTLGGKPARVGGLAILEAMNHQREPRARLDARDQHTDAQAEVQAAALAAKAALATDVHASVHVRLIPPRTV
jgi:hypothetical protein